MLVGSSIEIGQTSDIFGRAIYEAGLPEGMSPSRALARV